MEDSRLEANAIGGCEEMRRTPASGFYIAALTGVALLPLACWPNLQRAFFTPKLAILLSVDALLALLYWLRRPHIAGGGWQPMVWVAAVSVSALLGAYSGIESLALALAAAPLLWAAASGLLPARPLSRAVAAGACAESAIAVLQYLGADPLQWAGWQPETFSSPRMRVYGTLGNPDFVAAWCCAALPIVYWVWVERARSRRGMMLGYGIIGLQSLAILATGSRSVLLAFAAESVVLLVYRARLGGRPRTRGSAPQAGGWKTWLGMLLLAGLILVLPGSRTLTETLEGRLYLARVSVSHAQQIPPTGYGPGSFEPQFAQWQVQWLREHGTADARFAGPVDHAHNDYLEFLVEYGPIGLIALLAAALPWAAVWRSRSRPFSGLTVAALAGLAGLLAVAFVDFPLHRPAEWGLFWLFSGITVNGAK